VSYKIIDSFIYKFLLKWIKPEIIGLKKSGNKILSNVGVSNMSHLSNKENIYLGENVFIGHFNYIDGFRKVDIGDGCQITNYVSILTHSSHHAIRYRDKNFNQCENERVLKCGEISVGSYTFIGAHSILMPGTKLGKGCIVSAYSYVNGVFPDFSIIKGQPAVVIGTTKDYDEHLISEIPELKSLYCFSKNAC
jgi:acetyltransferase-like isoleucine patch superfamily enzyme